MVIMYIVTILITFRNVPFCVFAHGVTQKRPKFFSPINDTLCFLTEKEADMEVLIHAHRFDMDTATTNYIHLITFAII